MHYLLGHAKEEYGPCRIPANGSEQELKVDYGQAYENVRIRNGYSRLPPEEAAALRLKLQSENHDYAKDFGAYSAEEVNEAVEYLRHLFSQQPGFQYSVIERGVVACFMLKARARVIASQFDMPDVDVVEVLGERGMAVNMKQVMQYASEVAESLFKYWNNLDEWKTSLTSTRLSSNAFATLLNVSQQQLRSMDPYVCQTESNYEQMSVKSSC